MGMEMEMEMERISRTRWRNSRGQRPCHPRGIVIRHACETCAFHVLKNLCLDIFSADDRLKYIYPYAGSRFSRKEMLPSTFRHDFNTHFASFTDLLRIHMHIYPPCFHASTIEDFSFFYSGAIFKFSYTPKWRNTVFPSHPAMIFAWNIFILHRSNMLNDRSTFNNFGAPVGSSRFNLSIYRSTLLSSTHHRYRLQNGVSKNATKMRPESSDKERRGAVSLSLPLPLTEAREGPGAKSISPAFPGYTPRVRRERVRCYQTDGTGERVV